MFHRWEFDVGLKQAVTDRHCDNLEIGESDATDACYNGADDFNPAR